MGVFTINLFTLSIQNTAAIYKMNPILHQWLAGRESTQNTPLECRNGPILFSIDITRRLSAVLNLVWIASEFI